MKSKPVLGLIIVLLYLIGLVFLVLRIFNVIEWNWIWVTCPIWIDFIFCIILSIWIIGVCKLIDEIYE
jgi:hypothetical protein